MGKNIVCKFGGTSLASSQNIKKVKDIVLGGNKRFVVVSAPGKRFKEDIKITDSLIECFNLAKSKQDFSATFELLKNRFEEIKNDLGVELDLTPYLDELKQSISSHKSYDYVVSRGEFFSAKIISKFFGYEFLDASDFIVFATDGKVDIKTTKDNFDSLVVKNKNYVVPGFYGKTNDGKIKTFSRGGSDVTGAIVSLIADAPMYENWTDVDGFLVTDPKLCKNPALIEKLSYAELRELSYMGANVLHQDCARFLRENNIILNLRNTFNPTCKGSLIMPDGKFTATKKLTGIAGQKGFTIIHIDKFDLNESLGIIEKIANIFKKYHISIEHIPTGIDSVSIIVKSNFITIENKDELLSEIYTQIEPDKLEVIDNVALVSIVGGAIKAGGDFEREIFDSIYSAKTRIITLNKGASGISIIFGIPEKDFEKTIKTIYSKLF